MVIINHKRIARHMMNDELISTQTFFHLYKRLTFHHFQNVPNNDDQRPRIKNFKLLWNVINCDANNRRHKNYF